MTTKEKNFDTSLRSAGKIRFVFLRFEFNERIGGVVCISLTHAYHYNWIGVATVERYSRTTGVGTGNLRFYSWLVVQFLSQRTIHLRWWISQTLLLHCLSVLLTLFLIECDRVKLCLHCLQSPPRTLGVTFKPRARLTRRCRQGIKSSKTSNTLKPSKDSSKDW